MKATKRPVSPAIPKGWRRLPNKTVRKRGDRIAFSTGRRVWVKLSPENVGTVQHADSIIITIRRVRRSCAVRKGAK